jgi:branched-chain amino acid transport system substrate-binding protein
MAIEHNDQNSPDLKRKTIMIGVGAPLSGRAAALGREMSQAIQIAVDECNEEGGISGALVTLDSSDDAGKVELGESVARTLCAEANLLGVVGHYNSDVTLAASLIYDANSVTMITHIVSNPELSERNLANVFRFTNRGDETGLAIARHLRDETSKQRAVIVGTTTTYGRSMSSEFKTSFERLGGTIADEIWIEEGLKDLTRVVDQLPADYDLVFYGETFEGAPLLRSLRAAGRNDLFATGDGCWDLTNFLEPAGSVATAGEGVLVLSATPEIGQVQGARSFNECYSARYGRIGNYAINSYDATRVLLAAIKEAAAQAKSLPPREAIADCLRASVFQGIAYREFARWNAQGENVSAITALHVAMTDGFKQVEEIPRSDFQSVATANLKEERP